MASTTRGSRAVASLMRRPLPRQSLSTTTTTTTSKSIHRHGSTAAGPAPSSPPRSEPPIASIPLADAIPSSSTSASATPLPESQQNVTIESGVLLSRAPLLTRPLTPFEKAFFLYQKRLNERLVLPFTRYFYDKKGTPSDLDWKRKAKERNGVPARDIGGYQAYGETNWNDEVLVGDKTAEPKNIVGLLVHDAERAALDPREKTLGKKGEAKIIPIDKPLSRTSQADKDNDYKRLDRKLARSLYLLVKNKEGVWKLPSSELVGKEDLHRAAERIIVQTGGLNMNTWVVGRVPIGFNERKPKSADRKTIKTFFLKARIMAGQADLSENAFGHKDFRWLTKQEIEEHVHPAYWASVKNMIADR